MLDLRVDARQLLVPDRTANGVTSDFELTAGVTYHFGTQGPVHVSPPAVVAAAEPDRDMDTVPDRLDACPSEPEDVDGFDDDDGCPELDNDQDGVRDADDLCPSEMETKNGYRDDDGCPDQPLAELGAIAFGRESTRLDVAADAAVARAQQVLAQYPALSVEVAGYTSPDERTRDLARARAEAVKAALVKRGITAARVLTVGHAERKGRRSELKIVTPEQLAM
jgi:outer membrane protein OmpA-like peptidoglycan-associated protein